MKLQNETLEAKVSKAERELKEKEDYFQQQIMSREEHTNVQIRYLQNRLREVS